MPTSFRIFGALLALLLVGLAGCSSTPPPTATGPTASGSQSWSFDADPAGRAPNGSTVFSGTWTVRAEPGAPSSPNAVCQTATATYPALRLGSGNFEDVVVSTKFKPLTGSVDRAAGLLFRVVDKNNYYVLRANALEQNVQFFRYVHGSRDELNYANANVPSGTWQSLRVEMTGTAMRGYLNDRLVVQETDSTFAAGGVGLWTKADSVTCFDDVRAAAS